MAAAVWGSCGIWNRLKAGALALLHLFGCYHHSREKQTSSSTTATFRSKQRLTKGNTFDERSYKGAQCYS